MKTRQIFLCLSILACMFGAGCTHSHGDHARGSGMSTSAPIAKSTTKVRFNITGMHCGGCASGIRSELLRTRGVTKAVVDFKKGEAIVFYDAAAVDTAALMKVVSEAGYQATLKGR